MLLQSIIATATSAPADKTTVRKDVDFIETKVRVQAKSSFT